MIKSMTGYGKAEYVSESLNLVVEVKSLNSKNPDIMIKLPRVFSGKEVIVRKLLEKQLERGKISVSIEWQNNTEAALSQILNEDLFRQYYHRLKNLSEEVQAPGDDIFRLALYLPDVIASENLQDEDDSNWKILKKVLEDAIARCNLFREEEGEKLFQELKKYVDAIEQNRQEVDLLDPERIEHIKSRIRNNLEEYMKGIEYDENRFEQELIYYLEKMDITEEKVRLRSHIEYFLEEMNSERSNGKTLNFISQEIGREINTIGSKAGYAPITRHVVLMKENLEKIKEQLLNIL